MPEIKRLKGYSVRRKITFFELATHTSGLEEEPELPNAASGPIENWEKKVLEAIPATSIKKRPGKSFSYSNIGYAILGLALERAASKPFITLIEENIFIPLGMTNSYYIVPKEKIAQLAVGISRLNSGKIDLETPKIEHLGRGYKIPNGGIYSTPDDLSKFIIANLGYDSLLSADNIEFMQSGKVWTTPFLGRHALGGISLFFKKSEKKEIRYMTHTK